MQSVMYNMVKDHIVQHVQRTFKNGIDIAKSLRDLQKVDLLPDLPIRRAAAPAVDPTKPEQLQEQKIVQDGYDIKYTAKLNKHLEREAILDKNMAKAYALIYSQYCNKTMQNRIEEHPDFEMTIRDDPIELLNNIKILMHDPIRARYPFVTVTEALTRLLNI